MTSQPPLQTAGPLLFGGPDRPARSLRDHLQARVDAAPAGSRIDWATYYFRDRALARALMRASDRGVAVRLALEPRPRLAGANDEVVAALGAHGLNGGFALRRRLGGLGQLHAKIYAFSEPDVALIGSFNPSGDEPERPEVIAEIGDQDRGWNLLYAVQDATLVEALRQEVVRLSRGAANPLDRLAAPRTVTGGGDRLLFFPRFGSREVEGEVADVGRSGSVTAAISHLKPGPMTDALRRAAARGARVRLLTHATRRRAPDAVLTALARAGVTTTRVGDAVSAPMHNKFVVVRSGKAAVSWIGSYNINSKSRWLNDEVLLRVSRGGVAEALEARFAQMAAWPRAAAAECG